MSSTLQKNFPLFRTLYILGLLVVVAVMLFAAANQKSFWEDEAFSALFAQRDPSELLQGLSWDVHPPLYLFIAGQWGRLFGFDELGLRSFSILCTLAALLLTYKLGRDLFNERLGLVAITLLAFTPLLVMYGHSARYYALSLVLALLAAWSAYRFERPRQALFLGLYILSGTAFLYLLFAAAVVLAACNLWWLARWIFGKHDQIASGKRSIGGLVLWLAAQVVIVGLYLPGLRALQTVTGVFSELAEVSNWLVEIVKRAGYYGFVSAVGETLSPSKPLAWLGVALVIGLAIYAIWKNLRSLNFWLPVSFFVIITAANLLVTFNVAVSVTWQNLTYRALYAYPFLMIWLAAGLVKMKARSAIVAGAALLVVFLFGIFNYFTNQQFLRPVFTVPWNEIFQRIQQQASPEALVVCGYGDSSCTYYAGRYGFGQHDLYNWGSQADQDYPEVWYVQTNLGRTQAYGDLPEQQAALLDELGRRFPQSAVYNYAPQDASIRDLKARFMQQDDYEYRLVLHRFYR